jgi:hypothetical protein
VKRLRLAAVLAGATLAACAPIARLPEAPVPYGSAITIDSRPIPLDPRDPKHQQLGNFRYAGGVELTSAQTSRLHGLSDLKVWPDGRVLIEGDQSDQVTARLVLDASGRFVGLTDAHIAALKDERGVDLYAGGDKEYDSEGIAEFADGDRLVSFEQHDRMLRFPKGGGLPVAAPFPQVAYVSNKGMEGLAADPSVAPDAYRVGIEVSGETFLCRLSAGCQPGIKVDLEKMELSALEVMPRGRLAYLLRAFYPLRGNVVRLRIVEASGKMVDGFELSAPLTTENFEGVAAVPGPRGGTRFYIIADDNFGAYDGKPTGQRTLMMAFDWKG